MAASSYYPWSLAAPLGQVLEESGIIPSSHNGGRGYEFDMTAITKSPSALQPQPLSSPPPARTHNSTSSTTAATTFTSTANFTPNSAIPRPLPAPRPQATHRPRPVSMPPQAFSTPPTPTSSSDRDRQQTTDSKHGQIRHGSTSKQGRSSNRILGDYTLTKTLGAGSMGKVKLAIHNVTDEKVRAMLHIKQKCRPSALTVVRSSPLKFSLECTPRLPRQMVRMLPRKQSQSRLQKMLRKRYALSARLHSLCFSTTRTSAVCGR